MPKIINPSQIEVCIDALKKGDLVGMPTETVYGLAGNALCADTVLKIFTTKGRPEFDPLIVHTYSTNPSIEDLVQKNLIDTLKITNPMQNAINLLLKAFAPGPLSLVLPKSQNIPDIVTSGLQSVAIRYPAHPLAQELIKRSGLALAAPSANRFGRISPTEAAHVASEFPNTDLLILDGGPSQIGLESTVLSIDNEKNQFVVLRPGAIGKNQIEKVSGLKVISYLGEGSKKMISPGLLLSHYAPEKKLTLFNNESELQQLDHSRTGVLFFKKPLVTRPNSLILSPTGDIFEATKNLFKYLRQLDESDAKELIAQNILPFFNEQSVEHTLANAAQDRLNRAQFK